MVRSVINAVYSEVRGLHQAAYVLGVFTLGSQVLALVRDRMLAHQFGAGVELDLYYTAFRIPDFLYVLFASTLSVYVLIPFVAERMSGKGVWSAQKLLSDIFTIFIVAYTALALIIVVTAPEIVHLFFPGFAAEQGTLVLMIRILMIQPLLLGLSSLLGVITQFGHRFMLYAVSPLIYNIGIIFGLVVLYPYYGIQGLAWGVVIGALGHLLIQLPFVLRHELSPRLSFTVAWGDIGNVLRVSIPRALTLSLHQFVLLGFVGFASVMAVGSVSVFQFAFNLQSVPLAIVGVSYSVAAFPMLARLYSDKDYTHFSRLIMNALRHILFWSFPIVALLIVVRAQFVRVILGTGAFDWSDTRLTAAILALFALSLAAQAIHLLLVRALYATQNTRLPLYVTIISSAWAIISAYIFHSLILMSESFQTFLQTIMRLEGVEGIEVLALPLGYSCALIAETFFLLLLSRRQLFISARVLGATTLRGLLAALVAGFSAYTTLNFFAVRFHVDTLLSTLSQGFFATVMGVFGALIVYYLLKSPELIEAYQAIHRRLFKTTTVGPQDEDSLAL
jgi:putative peptidoglycan lipid II flippase